VVKRRLILVPVLDPDGTTEPGPIPAPEQRPRGDHPAEPGLTLELGPPGVALRVAIELDGSVVTVGRSQLTSWARPDQEVLAVARANTMTQPRQQLATTVIDGPDAGAVVSVITGGPGTAGIIADLDRALGKAAGRPRSHPLVTVVSPSVVLAGHLATPPPEQEPIGAPYRALARRLRALVELGQAGDGKQPTRPPRRRPPILLFLEPGRLSIFGTEDP
jgi:hypothetical protein